PGGCDRVGLSGVMASEILEPAAGLRQQVPGHVVLRIPDPGVQAGPDPAAGMKAVQRAAVMTAVQELRDRGRDDVLVRFQLAVKSIQEVMAVARVEVPGVLAV